MIRIQTPTTVQEPAGKLKKILEWVEPRLGWIIVIVLLTLIFLKGPG